MLGSIGGLKRLLSIAENPYHGLNFRQGAVSEMFPDNGSVNFVEVIKTYKAVVYDGMPMPDHVAENPGRRRWAASVRELFPIQPGADPAGVRRAAPLDSGNKARAARVVHVFLGRMQWCPVKCFSKTDNHPSINSITDLQRKNDLN